jgi:hypothetical protein
LPTFEVPDVKLILPLVPSVPEFCVARRNFPLVVVAEYPDIIVRVPPVYDELEVVPACTAISPVLPVGSTAWPAITLTEPAVPADTAPDMIARAPDEPELDTPVTISTMPVSPDPVTTPLESCNAPLFPAADAPVAINASPLWPVAPAFAVERYS